MGSLANKAIKDSFGDLLQVSNNNTGIDGTVRSIEDGEGTVSPLGLSDSTIQISGHIIPSSNASFDLGNAEYKIRHLFLSDNSLYIGDTVLSSTDATNIKGLDDGTFATQSGVDTALAAKADTTALGDYTTTADMNTALAAKADSSTLSDYTTTADMNTALAAKADATALDAKANTTDMNTALAAKADTTSVPTFSYSDGVLNITTN